MASFDGSGSADPDGTVASYAWKFGDGSTGTGVSPSHTYAAAGSFQVELTVTDDKGATNAVTKSVTVSAANQSPVAAFTSSAVNLVASFDGSGSADPDGTVASYAWKFGDGSTGTGVSPSHTYAAAGSFQVELTVTDDKGATNAVTKSVTVSAANQSPVAAFTSSAVNLVASFDGSGSADPDGTVASYAWKFGDGSTGTGVSPSHTYAAAGSFQVELTVTDDKGATNAVTKSVTVSAANQSPVAAFTSSAVNLVASFDGSGSADPDGTVASYAWKFGDGSTGTGVSPSHTYAAAGSFQVELTVTDDKGATNAVTKSVTVSAPVAGPTVQDTFSRTTTSGLGTANTGGAWSLYGSSGLFSVNGGTGAMTMPGAGRGAAAGLTSVSSSDTDVVVDFSMDKASTGGGQYVSLVGRGISFTSDYRTKVRVASNGAVSVTLSRVVSGAETEMVSTVLPGVTYTPGTTYSIRMQVWGTGTTNLRARVWKSSDTEPTGWDLTRTDTTAGLQTEGWVGRRGVPLRVREQRPGAGSASTTCR